MKYVDVCPGEPDIEHEGVLLFSKIVNDIPFFLLTREGNGFYHIVRFATEKEILNKRYDFRTENGFALVYYETDGMFQFAKREYAEEMLREIERNPVRFSGTIGWAEK